jgi:hypothetical protein
MSKKGEERRAKVTAYKNCLRIWSWQQGCALTLEFVQGEGFADVQSS